MLRKIRSYYALLLLLLLSVVGNSALGGRQEVPEGLNAGPDVITGDMYELIEFGPTGTQVGLAVSAEICNIGNVVVNFIVFPNTNHPIIPQNLYRMSGGSSNDDRFEQIGHSWVKHTFGAGNGDGCGFVCTGGDFSHLGIGCLDAYTADQNADVDLLGSRALVNPFTGVFQSNANDHSEHVHTNTSHKLLVERNDLNTLMNQGATYYAEVQYISSDEYAWCQTHPGQCNMYNNASYRRYNVTGTANFTFSGVGDTIRMTPAIQAWTGATINPIEPEPGVDGRGFVAYKVTNVSAGVWHYEYALYNQNLDRAIQSFSVPLGGLITVSNPGFHAPPNHPGFPNDGTMGGAGFSNAAWSSNQTTSALTWSTETFAQNQNANAIRWGTLYNFRFDSNRPPQTTNATIGFFKTGTPVTVEILGPDATNATPTPIPTPTPGTSPTPTPAPTPSPLPSAVPGGTPAWALNLSARVLVQTGDNVGIGGFIIPRELDGHDSTRRLIIRAVGPSLADFGVLNPLADPILEVSGSGMSVTLRNDNWRDDIAQVDPILHAGLAPSSDLESALSVSLHSGSYTAVVRGKNDTSGVALVEVYDVSGFGLPNMSTRAFVSTGDDVVIAGFILGGETFPGPNTGAGRIVVRGLGPSLAFAGVANPLEDPTLELRDGNGALLIANNDWHDDPAQAAELIASHLGSLLDSESAIVAPLPPGVYTVLLAGRNNGTGVGLVEVYDRDYAENLSH
jgi:hypothetical protein